MRLLKFNVHAQHIQKDPECDFNGIVAGTSGYLRAQFALSSEWQNCTVVASFWRGSKEYAALLENGECMIPTEALKGHTFRVSLTGQRDNYRITTDKVLVRQEVSR